MNVFLMKVLAATIVTFVVVGATPDVARAAESAEATSLRQQARKLMDDGNYLESLAKFRDLILDGAGDSSDEIAKDFRSALACYQQLNQVDQIDDFRERLVAKYPQDWIVLAAVAQSYQEIIHQGFLIAGEFRRGDHRGGGKVMHATARDRVRAMQLFMQAMQLVDDDQPAQATSRAAALLTNFANAVMFGGHHQAWRLQTLTNLDDLPDYEEGWGYYSDGVRGAPVDPEGNPVFYDDPAAWQDAKNDGQRWRWLLAKRTQWQPEKKLQEWRERAQFLQSQFGVETMADYGWWFARQNDDADAAKNLFALQSLSDDETIARLATGIKRFKLPDEQNPLRLYEQIMVEATKGSPEWQNAGQALASTFENRRQYPRAAELWRQLADSVANEKQGYLDRLDQVVKPWGRFEPVMTQPAGRGATIDYRFRNGKRVEFTAQPVKIPALIADLKKYLADNAGNLQWEQMNIDQLGYRLVVNGQEKYLAAPAARWSLDLEPRANHFDRRVTVTTPLQKAGAYLLTAKLDDGNTQRIVVWIADTAIVKKPLQNKALYYVADAVTGKAIPKCNVEFFGYWQEQLAGGNKYRVNTKDFAELTNADGLLTLPADEDNNRYQWLAVATTPEGRLAYLGFSGVWQSTYQDQQYQQVKVFTITDRPVYRPGQEVHFKFWVANAQYDQPDASEFAAKSFVVEIRDPRNEKVHSETIVAGAFGGIAGSWKMPAGATLGQYQLMVVNHGGGGFRVEEYKKPEYEVTIDAPEKPVMLGEKVRAKITAKYYFGSPVTEARVKYKVLRTSHDQQWYPPRPWDWLYGPGYWWFADDYRWFPGWSRWGCARPFPWWFWRPSPPPEVVAEQETTIGPDGSLDIEIDTAPAKAFHPNTDHSYRIEAEVVDQSRRTITASGQVLVARQPFRVYVWGDRGFYRAGDTMKVYMAARTLDGRPVQGPGVLRLLKIAYQDGKPVENEVAKWDLPTNAQGDAELQLKASEAGQYRLAYEVTGEDPLQRSGSEKPSVMPESSPPRKIEGGLVVVVRGDAFDGSDFRFNALELTPEKSEYAPGEVVSLQISSNRAGATVLLFLRPSNGVYLPPQVVQLKGKTALIDVEVAQRDMPNFFIEAVAVHTGGLHTAVREIFVPPASRVFDVAVEPSEKEYLPGQHATVRFKLTNLAGKPVVGSTVVAIYDKALDYIAGGAGPADIREFFWKWRRNHQTQSETSLNRGEAPVAKPNEKQMTNLGVFGESTADEQSDESLQISNSLSGGPRRRSMLGAKAVDGAGYAEFDSLMPAAPMAAAAPESAVLEKSAGGPSSGAAVVEPTIRQNFADTALWVGTLETDAQGVGEVELDMPENLTAWKINVWGMGRGTRVGQGSAEVVTRKNIIVRLQAPRFFVETDEVVLSANVHNYLKTDKQVRVKLDLEGNTLIPISPAPSPSAGRAGEGGEVGTNSLETTVELPAGGEHRVDWRVRVVREGQATIRMSALTDEESDAMQMSFPVLVHGMLNTQSFSGAIRPNDDRGSFTFTVPEERRPEATRLEVRYSPTLAGAMVDALPYLADYPYGCTEQTLNRFLPAVLTQRTLQRMGVDLKAIQAKRTNLNAQEIGDDAERAAQWQRFDRNPVFDEAELNKIVKANVDRLTEMQLSDGGWGWFSGWGERSTAHTTATVVRGLLIARDNDVAVVPVVLENGLAWLRTYQAAELKALDNYDREAGKARNKDERAKPSADNLDALVYLVLTESQRAGASPPPAPDANAAKTQDRMRTYLYGDRTNLAVYSLATFGLALEHELALDKSEIRGPKSEMLSMILRNISQYVRQDDENQTAWLDLPGGNWWHWYGSEYEAHAYYLKLLAAAEPQSEVASRLVKYLVNNRKHSTYWNSTRDTALVVEAFSDYLKATGEAKPNMSLAISIDGETAKTVEITPENLFTFDNKFVLEGDRLPAGDHIVELKKLGEGPVYFNGYLTNFTLEDPITAAGLELKVDRRYFKLTPAKKTAVVAGSRGQALEQAVEKYDRTPLDDLAELKSGDLVEVELVVDSKNDYEYIMMEDMKPAGFEAVEIRSDYNGNEMGAYVEFRDERVCLFAAHVARGQHGASYRLRAEIPGRFSALPTKVSAMYAPELKANSDEFKVQIVD